MFPFGKVFFTIHVANEQIVVTLNVGVKSKNEKANITEARRFRNVTVDVTMNNALVANGRTGKNETLIQGNDGCLVTVPLLNTSGAAKELNRNMIVELAGSISSDEYISFDITFEVERNKHTVIFN